MRVNVILILIACICALTGLSHPSARTSDRAIHNLEWGRPSEGIQMSLEVTDSNRAEFQGTGAKLVNLDMPAIKLMNFWLGKVQSNVLTIER